MVRLVAMLGLVSVAGCHDHASAPAAPRTAPAALVASPATPDDAVVAQVNGAPVYASCVSAQAAHAHTDAQGGLDQCIEFELLAQAAATKGLVTDPDVVDTTRAALVNRVVELGFEATHRTPADVKAQLDIVMARDPRGTDDKIHVPEERSSAYARVVVPPNAPPDRVAAASQLADDIYHRLAGEEGLLPADLHDTGAAVVTPASGFELTAFEVPQHPEAWFDGAYGKQLFGISDIGRVAPPVRTGLGFDVILFNGDQPAYELTRDDRVAQVFPELRRSLFKLWVDSLMQSLKVKITEDPAQVEQVLEASS